MRRISLASLNKGYVAGFLETLGGLYVKKLLDRTPGKCTYPLFRIVCHKDTEKAFIVDKITEWFYIHHRLKFNRYDLNNNMIVFQVETFSGMEKLIRFMKQNCYIERKNQDKVEKLLAEYKIRRTELNES
jgi:hypothetical protein